jgi:catechol 2,3-dioxygenase-like lactoylglutathione lyase family enzyme
MGVEDLRVARTGAIAFTVNDVERSVAFYTQAFGFEVVTDLTLVDDGGIEGAVGDRVRVVRLTLGKEAIELMQYLDVESQPLPPDSQSNDLWFQHFAIVVSDLDAAYAHLQSLPIEPISTAPQTFPPDNVASAHIRAFKFRDRDRHNLEIIWFPPDKSQEKWLQQADQTDRLFLGIDHSAIAIAHTAASLPFYRDQLGLPVENRSFNWRELQARLDGLPAATVQVTALRPEQGDIGIELLDYIEPGTGRPKPTDWQRCDIPYMHIELLVENVEAVVQHLQPLNLSMRPLKWVHPDDASVYREGMVIDDPSGHALLLLASS